MEHDSTICIRIFRFTQQVRVGKKQLNRPLSLPWFRSFPVHLPLVVRTLHEPNWLCGIKPRASIARTAWQSTRSSAVILRVRSVQLQFKEAMTCRSLDFDKAWTKFPTHSKWEVHPAMLNPSLVLQHRFRAQRTYVTGCRPSGSGPTQYMTTIMACSSRQWH